MLLPDAGRAGVQRWDQGSLVTFASTGAVQPLTCCTAEFPPLGCTGRKLLSTNGSSLLSPLRALDWEERGGGNMPNQEEIIQTPDFAAVPHQHRLQKSLTGHSQPGNVDGGSQKGRRTSPAFFSRPTTGPAKPTRPWHGDWQRGVMHRGVSSVCARAPSCRSCTKVPSNAITRGFSLTSLGAATREGLGMMPLTVTSSSPLAKAAGREKREGGRRNEYI